MYIYIYRSISEHVIFYVVVVVQKLLMFDKSVDSLSPLNSDSLAAWFVIRGLAPSMSFMVIRPSRRSEGAEILALREHRDLVSASHFMVKNQRRWVEKRRFVDSIDSGKMETFFCSRCCQAPEVSLTIVSALVWAWLKCTRFLTCSKLAGAEKLLDQEEEEVSAGQKGCWEMLKLFHRNSMPSKIYLYCQVAIDNCYCRMFWNVQRFATQMVQNMWCGHLMSHVDRELRASAWFGKACVFLFHDCFISIIDH